jgi:hypothetical protein
MVRFVSLAIASVVFAAGALPFLATAAAIMG